MTEDWLLSFMQHREDEREVPRVVSRACNAHCPCVVGSQQVSIRTSSSSAVGEVTVENEERTAAWISFMIAMMFFSRRMWRLRQFYVLTEEIQLLCLDRSHREVLAYGDRISSRGRDGCKTRKNGSKPPC